MKMTAVPLQVQEFPIINPSRTLSRFLPLSGDRAKEMRGSLTVEGALALSLFIFAIILSAVPMEFLHTHRKVQTAMETVGRQASQAVYLKYGRREGKGQSEADTQRFGINDKAADSRADEGNETEHSEIDSQGAGKDDSGNREELAESAALRVYLACKIADVCGNRIRNLNVGKTEVAKDGTTIDLCATWSCPLPWRVFGIQEVPFRARCLRHGWIGEAWHPPASSGESDEEVMVYVGRNSTRYHLSPTCHYLSNDIRSIPRADAGKARNKEGKLYRPCAVCGRESDTGHVFVLPGGEVYHSRPDCSSLSYYIRRVPLSEVEHLGACSYCGGRE